jgi:hypothetical protein
MVARQARALVARWIVTLADRPFRPAPEQLAREAGGDLVEGEARARRLPMAAARHAALFADHVGQGGRPRRPGCLREGLALSPARLHRQHGRRHPCASLGCRGRVMGERGRLRTVAAPPGVDQRPLIHRSRQAEADRPDVRGASSSMLSLTSRPRSTGLEKVLSRLDDLAMTRPGRSPLGLPPLPAPEIIVTWACTASSRRGHRHSESLPTARQSRMSPR